MLAFLAKLAPLWYVVRSTVKDIDLSICAIRAHNVLLDRFANSDLLDKIVERGLSVLPFCRRNDLNNAGLHTVAVNLGHLDGSQ